MLYPFKLDLERSRVLQIEMDEAAFRAASFLDDRILTPATRGAWAPLSDLMAATAVSVRGDARPLHFIFHTGHVGSTLVSRLLDETGRVLPLREPLPLRTLAAAHDALQGGGLDPDPASMTPAQFDALLAMLLRLWSLGYATTEAVILKATSSAARLAPALLNAARDSRAIYLNLRAEPYLATLLAGQNSPIDLRGHAPERLRRLAARLASPLPALGDLSLGELAALSWLAETLTQQDLIARYPTRVVGIDFDAFLADVAGHLQGILAHFRLPQDPECLGALLRSPVLTRYSKAPEHPYDPALRAEVLQDARRHHRGEIGKGLRLLERLHAAG